MRLLLILVVALAAVPAALAEDNPGPAAVAACQAEAAQLGKDAFVAKYGPSEPFGHCYAAHAGTTTTTTTTAAPPHDSPAVAACKAEAEHIGTPAFVAKYGSTETLGHCVAAHTGTTTTTTTTAAPPHEPPAHGAEKAAQAACLGEGKKLGKDAFVAKYGAKNPLAACLKALKKTKR